MENQCTAVRTYCNKNKTVPYTTAYINFFINIHSYTVLKKLAIKKIDKTNALLK